MAQEVLKENLQIIGDDDDGHGLSGNVEGGVAVMPCSVAVGAASPSPSDAPSPPILARPPSPLEAIRRHKSRKRAAEIRKKRMVIPPLNTAAPKSGALYIRRSLTPTARSRDHRPSPKSKGHRGAFRPWPHLRAQEAANGNGRSRWSQSVVDDDAATTTTSTATWLPAEHPALRQTGSLDHVRPRHGHRHGHRRPPRRQQEAPAQRHGLRRRAKHRRNRSSNDEQLRFWYFQSTFPRHRWCPPQCAQVD